MSSSPLRERLPSPVAQGRGAQPSPTAGDLIILEEAAYCDPGLISEVVVPLLSMSKSVLLCISTLLDGGNHYSKMFNLSDALGRPLFSNIQISLVCAACLKTDEPEKCTHKLAEMPRWLSSNKMEIVKGILADDPAMLLRESMGLASDGTHKAFPSHLVDAFFNRPRIGDVYRQFEFEHPDNTNNILVAVDPSGGGASQFAVCSAIQLPNGTVVVLGLDLLRTKVVANTHTLVIDHCKKVRQIPGLEDAVLVLSFESNLAFESQHLLKAFERNGVKKWVALSEGAGGTLGWLTTNERKEAMCLQVRDALTVGSISLSSHFFSIKMDVKDALKALGNEMRAFAILVEPPKTTFGKVRKTYSGKVGGEQDDACIALQLAVTGLRCFYTSERYARFRKTNQIVPP